MSCTPDNAAAKLTAMLHKAGSPIEDTALTKLSTEGQAMLQNGINETERALLGQVNEQLTGAVNEYLSKQGFTKNTGNAFVSNALHTLRPSEALPPQVADPILGYIDQAMVAREAGQLTRSEFKRGLKAVFNEVDTTQLTSEQTKIFSNWKEWNKDGQAVFGPVAPSPLDEGLSNVVRNQLALSSTIALGNPLELAVKAPTLYGIRPSVKGVITALQETGGNLFGRIPELEQRGLYKTTSQGATNVFEQAQGRIGKAIEALNTPGDRLLKNVSYGIGKAQTGTVEGGMKALEDIAFISRPGNQPLIYQAPTSKSLLTLTGYTYNSLKMLGGLFNNLLNPTTSMAQKAEAARALTTYIAMASAIGGFAAAIPQPISDTLEMFNPEYKEWKDNHSNNITGLIQVGSLGIGITPKLIETNLKRASQDYKKAAEAYQQGDTLKTAVYSALGLMPALSVTNIPLAGSSRIQKSIDNSAKLFMGDLTTEEYQSKLGRTWFPFMKQED